MNQLAAVFIDAALPQKAIIAVLCVSILAALVIAARNVRRDRSAARASGFISELRVAGPALGLLTASFVGFHMAQTALRLPYPPTVAMLAPGVMEIASLAGLGALAGLVAVALYAAGRGSPGERSA
jgi:hypothetical protein